jgi:hypothetical protein
MSYIVSNCPAYLIEEDYCTCYLEVCSDCTDCVIKQVIEKCGSAVSDYSNLEILRTACETSEAYSKANIAEKILQLFDIKEVK